MGKRFRFALAELSMLVRFAAASARQLELEGFRFALVELGMLVRFAAASARQLELPHSLGRWPASIAMASY